MPGAYLRYFFIHRNGRILRYDMKIGRAKIKEKGDNNCLYEGCREN